MHCSAECNMLLFCVRTVVRARVTQLPASRKQKKRKLILAFWQLSGWEGGYDQETMVHGVYIYI